MSMTIIHQPLRQPTVLPQRLNHESPGSVGRRSLGEVVCKVLDLGAGPRHPIQLSRTKPRRSSPAVHATPVTPYRSVLSHSIEQRGKRLGGEALDLIQIAGQDIGLAMGEKHPPGRAVLACGQRTIPVGMVAEDKAPFIVSSPAGAPHRPPARGEGALGAP